MVLPLCTPLLLIVVLWDAAVPGLAVKVTLFTTTVPVPEEAVKVPVWLAAAPPKFMLQSRPRGCLRIRTGAGPMGCGRLTGALNRAVSVAKSGAGSIACCIGFRFICCIL